MKLTTVYMVLTSFEKLGLGNAGDAETNRSKAYDQYAECRDDDRPARVFRMCFRDSKSNDLISCKEMTEGFEADYARTKEARGQ